MNAKLLAHFDKFKSTGLLPSPKGPALAVVRLTQQDDVTNEQLARAIQGDPALVARLLMLANACRSSDSRPVLAIKDAISVLGLNAVRGLALGFSLMKDQSKQRCPGFDYPAFWARNLARATAMQALTAASRLMQSDEAFCLGLLSQIGELGLASLFMDDYARLLSKTPATELALLQAEQDAFEFDHAELSGALLTDWGFPGNLVDLVRMYEKADAAHLSTGSRQESLLLTLMLASKVATICMAQPQQRRAMMANLLLLGGKLSMDAADLLALCDRVVCDWTHWCSLLKVPSYDLPPFVDLMNAPAPPVLRQGDGQTHVTSQSGFRVLLVDDSVVMRDLLKDVLGNAGYICSEAENGRIGLELALAELPDLMVVDWAMPEMDGITLVRQLRESRAGRAIYILLLTAMDQEEKLAEAFSAGVDDFLTKPPKPNVLLSRLLAGQRVVALNQEIKRDQCNLQRFATEFAKLNGRLQETRQKNAIDHEHFRLKERQDVQRARDFSLSASDWFWETDAKHGFCYFSDNFEKVYGLPPEQLLGQSRETLLKRDATTPREQIAAHLAQLAGHVVFKNFEYQVRIQTNEIRWVSVSGVPHFDGTGQFAGYRGTGSNITERKRAEAKLRQAVQMAQAANLAKSRFLATMSHEIRTPMNGILGMAQMMLQATPNEAQRTDYARTILSSGHTLLALLNDILDLSKIEAGKFQVESTAFAPEALLQETCNLFSSAAQTKGLQIDCRWHGPPGQRYLADARRLRQMIANLAGNALKFTARGHVRIDARQIECEEQTAVLEFSVQDSGIGVAGDKIDLLFKPFSQGDSSTTREFGGSGLGLSIVRQLAQAMGGEVGVESQKGQGSNFWFRIRAQRVVDVVDSRVAVRSVLVQADSQPATYTLQGHLLVAEDNSVNAMVIQSLLSTLGVTMTLVGDGQQAVDAVSGGALNPPVSLILMDLHMPVMDGYTATQLIRQMEAEKKQPRLPIIALTADAFQEDHQHCLEVGMDDFLTKPISIEVLTTALAKWLPRASTNQAQVPAPVEPEPLDIQAFNALVKELTPMLQQSKFAVIGRFNQLQALVCGTSIAADIDALTRPLQDMRFDLVLIRLLEIDRKLRVEEP